MLDSASKTPGPSIMQEAMPPAAQTPSHIIERTENSFQMNCDNVGNGNIAQAQRQSSTPKGSTWIYHPARTLNRECIYQGHRVQATGPFYLLTTNQQKTQQNGHPSHAQGISQQNSTPNNGNHTLTQQRTQFTPRGHVITKNGPVHGNNINHCVPRWPRSTPPVSVEPQNIGTTMGGRVGYSNTIPIANIQNNSLSSNVMTMHRNTYPIILPNPSGFTNLQPVSNLVRNQAPIPEIFERCATAPGQTRCTQSLQTSSSSNQRYIVLNKPVRFQPEMFQSVSMTPMEATPDSIFSADSPTAAVDYSTDKEANLPPEACLAMKRSCQNSVLTTNIFAAGLPRPMVGGGAPVKVCANGTATQSSGAGYVSSRCTLSSSINSPNVNGRLAGNTLPGDMLMTARGVGLPVSKSVNHTTIKPRILAQQNLPVTAQPNTQSSTLPIPVKLVSKNNHRHSSMTAKNSSTPPEPFIRSTYPPKRTTDLLALSNPSSSFRNNASFVSGTARRTSIDHNDIQMPNFNDPSPLVSQTVVQEVNSKDEEQNTAEAHCAPVIARRRTPTESRILSPQVSNDSSFNRLRSESTSKETPEQCSQYLATNRHHSLSSAAHNQNEITTYGYDHESLAKSRRQSSNSLANGLPSASQPEFPIEQNNVRTSAKKVPKMKVENIFPTAPTIDQKELPLGYDKVSYFKERGIALQQHSHLSSDQISMDSEKTGSYFGARVNTPMSMTKAKEFDDDSTCYRDKPTSAQSGVESPRGFKRVIPPISSDSDSEDVESEVHRKRARGTNKKKWRRIIVPSDSSDSDTDVDTTIQVRVHSPKPPASRVNMNLSHDANTNSRYRNAFKRNQDDLLEPEQSVPKHCRFQESITTEEFMYMTSCKVRLQRIDDEFVSLKAPAYSDDENDNQCESPVRATTENACVEQSSASLTTEMASHTRCGDKKIGGTEEAQYTMTSQDDSANKESSQTPDEQSEYAPDTRHYNSSQEAFSSSESRWRERRSNSPKSLKDFGAVGSANAHSNLWGSNPCSKPTNNGIERTILPGADLQYRSRRDSYETDSTHTYESSTRWHQDQSYVTEREEYDDLSNAEENETPYHSEVEYTPSSDDEEIPDKVKPCLKNKVGERSIERPTRVNSEEDLHPHKLSALPFGRNEVLSENHEDVVDGEPETSRDNMFKRTRISDEDGDLSSSYTSSNSGSPIKFDNTDLRHNTGWPFSADFFSEGSFVDDSAKRMRNSVEMKHHSEIEDISKQVNITPNYLRHQPTGLLADKTSLINSPEVHLTKFLKLRNRRTHKSRERRLKKEFLKNVGLHGKRTNSEYMETFAMRSSLSFHPKEAEQVKTKSPILEGCARSGGVASGQNDQT